MSTPRGRTAAGRKRAREAARPLPAARPLLRTTDHGAPIHVRGEMFRATGERWIEPFLEANRLQLRRLRLTPSVETRAGLRVTLTPADRIGAVPLVSPSTRKVVAGLLVSPRFRWPDLGAVMTSVGFRTEPTLGGSPHVPGSAREVPGWLIAAPVLRRIEGLLAHRRRDFVQHRERRASPRGRVDWRSWATRDVPAGRWATLPCEFPEPDDDPRLMANVRWTLERLADSLLPHAASAPGHALQERVRRLQLELGPGAIARPHVEWSHTAGSAWLADGLQAMGWVRDERGLGGDRSLDGLAWDLCVDELWEAWVDRFAADLAPRLGLAVESGRRRGLNWRTPLRSMDALVPDVVLRGRDRLVILDAKYKAHFHELARRDWRSQSESLRDAHRADLHQALAYAALADVGRVDTVLVYPRLAGGEGSVRTGVATLVSGARRVRLFLMELRFGFATPHGREAALGGWAEVLVA